MGWTSYHANYYKNGKVDRKAECDAYFADGLNRGHFEILKSAMVGKVYYAAIRNLTKCAGKDESGKDVYVPEKNNRIWAAVFITSTNMRDYHNFSYKPMDESVGPFCYDCPASILSLLSKTDSEFANEWRTKCRENIKNKKNPSALHKLPVGTKIEFESEYDMTSGTKKGDTVCLVKCKDPGKNKKAFWADGHYRWKSGIIPKNYRVIA